MSRALQIHRTGPGTTVQDRGRAGYLALGLSRGGAADPLALAEGAALLGQEDGLAALELTGVGGEYSATEDMRIALTGAPMRASIDGSRIAWNASHLLHAGARLSIGAADAGVYGYLHLGGGVTCAPVLGARSAHLAAGLGAVVKAGDSLPVGPDTHRGTGWTLAADKRFGGGTVRVVTSLQTEVFSPPERARFEATVFRRDSRGNRMGVRVVPEGPGFASPAGLSVLSEVIVPGDIQITGDGTPFVLMCECQTTGGYPRIGSVLPSDLPRVAQTRPGETLRFAFVPLETAVDIERRAKEHRRTLGKQRTPLIRDPARMPDLLSYQLISGATAGNDLDPPQP